MAWPKGVPRKRVGVTEDGSVWIETKTSEIPMGESNAIPDMPATAVATAAPSAPAPLWDIETELFKAVKAAFPKGKIEVEQVPAHHPKVAPRKLGAQVKVRVSGLTATGTDLNGTPQSITFAVATMVPADGDDSDIDAAITRLHEDEWKAEDSLGRTIS